MFKKIHFSLIGLVIISLPIFGSASIAQTPNRKPTMWGVIDKSLTELLDSGWKITNYSVYVLAADTRGITSVVRTYEKNHVYLLYKNGKNISCFIVDPQPNEAYSGCRQLN